MPGRASFLCRLLTAIVNLPAWLLHRLYLALRPAFDGSFFAGLAFEMGHETAVAQSWLIMLLWVIPFSRWNNAYTLLGFAALLVLFFAGAMPRERFRLDVKTVGFYPVVLFGSVFLAVLFSYEPSASFRFLFYHISAAACVLVTVSAVRGTEDLKRLAAGGGVCVLASSLYGVYQRIQGVEVNESYVDMTVNAGMPGRVESYFDNPNTFAEVLILLLPLVLALILCSRHAVSRLMACGVFAVGVLALGMTYSRASWVGMACAMAVLVFLWKPRLIPLFIALCVLMVPFLPDTIWHRVLTIFNPADSSTASRIPLYQAALEVIKTSPVSGAGLGTAAVQDFIRDYNLYHAEAPFVHAHNFYLQVWIEAGVLGFVSFFRLHAVEHQAGGPHGPALCPLRRPDHHLRRLRGPVRRHGLRPGGLSLELPESHVHLLVRVRPDGGGRQGLPRPDGDGLRGRGAYGGIGTEESLRLPERGFFQAVRDLPPALWAPSATGSSSPGRWETGRSRRGCTRTSVLRRRRTSRRRPSPGRRRGRRPCGPG